jgi:ATP-dependent protease ClpP protease subunit
MSRWEAGVGMFGTYPVVLIAMLVAGFFGAQACEARTLNLGAPIAASAADNACASIAAYAQTHAEAEILPYIKSCGGNPVKAVCEQTINMMKTADPAKERTYGLTCVGSP